MSTELAVTENKSFNFEITSLDQAMEYAKLISESDLAPKDYRGKPGNVLIAMQYGAEVGLKPMQAIQNIAVINGRPSVWGDAMIALVQSHPICEYIKEYTKDAGSTACCAVKRKGEDEYVYEFSKEDAKAAGLLGKPGPWTQYPDRMLQMRARGFALRDKFSDVLKGIALREEVEDYQVVDINERAKAAHDKIANLIEGKAIAPRPLDVADKIALANNIDDLKVIKHEITVALKEKHAELMKVNPETGEIKE